MTPASTSFRHATTPEALLRVAFWAVLLAVVTYTRTDPDLWGHVRFGLDVLRDFAVARADPYSFTSDRAWINHEWAAEAISAGAFVLAGNAGLVLLKVSVVAAVLLLLQSVLRREGVDQRLDRDMIAGLAVIGTLEQAHHLRPQLFSLLFFALLLWCLTSQPRRHPHAWLALLPPLFAVWANVHGGWMVGGGVLALWAIGLACGGAFPRAVWCAAAGAAALAATLLNPYGVGLWEFLRETVAFGRADIREWQPVYALDPHILIVWAGTLAASVAGFLRSRQAAPRPERVLIVTTLAVASFQVSRLLAFFVLATLFLFGAAVADALRQRRPVAIMRGNGRSARAAIAAIAICVTIATAPVLAVNIATVHIDRRHVPEAGAVEFLPHQAAGGRLLVWFDWGQYAIWHLPAGLHVSMDGRRETVYSADVLDRHLRFYFDVPGGAALPDELAATYVWIPRSLPAARRLRTDADWISVYEGEQSVIFGRAGKGRIDAPVRSDGVSATRRFPGP